MAWGFFKNSKFIIHMAKEMKTLSLQWLTLEVSGIKVAGLHSVLSQSLNGEIITDICGEMSSHWDLSKNAA